MAGHVQGAEAGDSGLSEPCSFAATDVGGIDIVEDKHAGDEGVCGINIARLEKNSVTAQQPEKQKITQERCQMGCGPMTYACQARNTMARWFRWIWWEGWRKLSLPETAKLREGAAGRGRYKGA